MKLSSSPVALWLIVAAVSPMLSSCAARSSWALSIDKVGPTYVPAIDMNGVVQRVVALTIAGPPELVAPLMQRAQTEGWRAHLLDKGCIQIDPVGHSLDEVTALSFRVNNGEFGDLKFNVILRPDGKTKA